MREIAEYMLEIDEIVRTAVREAIAHERKECAKEAEGTKLSHIGCEHEPLYWDGRQDAATCIRAR